MTHSNIRAQEEIVQLLNAESFGKIKLWHGLLVLVTAVFLIGLPSAYHYNHVVRHDEEGIEIIPDATAPCEAARKTAIEECRTQLEEAWFGDGAHYYTRKQMTRDLPICRTIGDDVMNSCEKFRN